MLSTSEILKLKKYIDHHLDLLLNPSNIQVINEHLLNEPEISLVYNSEGYSLAITEDTILISISCEEITNRMKGHLQLDNVVLGITTHLDSTFTALNLGKLPEEEFSLRTGIGIFDTPPEWSDKIIAIEVDMDLDKPIELAKSVFIFGLIAEALLLKALLEEEKTLSLLHYAETELRS